MKTKIFGGIALMAIAAVIAFNVSLNLNKSNNQLSQLALANVEALAGETGTAKWLKLEQNTETKVDDVVVSESQCITCTEGGTKECSAIRQVRYKTNGSWGNWTPW